jgi:hypothetical protein
MFDSLLIVGALSRLRNSKSQRHAVATKLIVSALLRRFGESAPRDARVEQHV